MWTAPFSCTKERRKALSVDRAIRRQRCSVNFAECRKHIDVLSHCVHNGTRRESSRPSRDKGRPHAALKHRRLLSAQAGLEMTADAAVVGHEDDDRSIDKTILLHGS